MCATKATGRGRSSRRRPSRNSRTRPACDCEPKTPDAAVRGQHAVDGAVGEHDQLVDALRQRAELRNGRTEHRVGRVDDLGGEDQPHTFSTSAGQVVGVLLGRRLPAVRRLLRTRCEPRGELTVGEHPDERLLELRLVVGKQPADAVLDRVADPADVHRHGRPAAQEGLEQHATEPLRARRQHEARRGVERGRDLRRLEALDPFDLLPAGRARGPRPPPAADPRPTIFRRASGTRGATRRHTRASPSTFL